MQLTTNLRWDFLVERAAGSLKPDDPARADHNVVAEGVAASNAALRVFKHVGESRKARMRVRRERAPTHAKVIEDGDWRRLLPPLVKIDAFSGKPVARPPRLCLHSG